MRDNSTASKKIFVSIAGFCDPLLLFSVKSALEHARYPERLVFGIVDQSEASLEDELRFVGARFGYLQVAPHQSRGACWARALAMTLYGGEDYFFQIDSHTHFDADWDVALTDALEEVSAKQKTDKIVLSTRPFAFEFNDTGQIETKRFTQNTLKLTPKEGVIRLSDPVLKYSAINAGTTADLPGHQISAAFVFTRGQFVNEVPYDPFFYFHGEEQNISIRAFTRGWEIWHPNKAPLYHLYKTRAEGEAPLHWDAQFEGRRQENWQTLRSRATSRLTALLNKQLEGVYGLGPVRSIDDYLKLSGLKLENDLQVLKPAKSTSEDSPHIESSNMEHIGQPAFNHVVRAQERQSETTMTTSATQPALTLPDGASGLNETYQDWTLICAVNQGGGQNATPNTHTAILSQKQRKRDTNQLVLAAEFNQIERDRISGTLVLPFGLRLADGVSLQIGSGPISRPFAFATALPTGILLPVSFDAGSVRGLKAGGALYLRAKAWDSGQDVMLSVSLKGFAEAHDRYVGLQRQ